MQAARPIWGLNRRHPDAKTCVAAWPMSEGVFGTVGSMANAASKRYRMTCSTAVGGSRTVMQNGWGHRNTTSFTFQTTDALPAPTSFSWMFRHNPDVTGAFPRELFEVSGYAAITEIAKTVSLYSIAGTNQCGSFQVLNLGTEYSIGIRYNAIGTQISIFINGHLDSTQTSALTLTSSTLIVGGGTWRNTGTGNIRDIRIFNSALPNESFMRYHVDPNSFYLRAPSALRGVASANFGRLFFPFLHPALQS